ncbi:MAG: glycoside hydrolase family 55 protein [Opitutaceae bacterium]|nr:glycoside hydrolase family 55 protein [Opitutaceae bacterium]
MLSAVSAAPAGLRWLTFGPLPADAAPTHSRLVYPGPDGRLIYAPDDSGGTIPDFSMVGYRSGGVLLPDVAVQVTLQPQPGSKDDRARIQAALDRVAALPRDAHGFRGAVLLKRGQYRVKGPLKLAASGVVLRGEGPGEDGTVLIATLREQHSLIEVGGAGNFRPEEATRQPVVGKVAAGALRFEVQDASRFKVGDTVIVHRPSTREWLAELGMDRLTETYKNPNLRNWEPGSYDMHHHRVITAIDGATVTINAPVLQALDPRFGGGSLVRYDDKVRIEEVGVEELRIVSDYDRKKKERPNELTKNHPIRQFVDEDHAWVGVMLDRVRDAWVRRVTVLHTGYGAVHCAASALRVTVQDCAMIDAVSRHTGGRKYSFGANGQLGLFLRCYARNGRHDFVLASRVVGPNAFVDCQADDSSNSSEPHHRYSVGCLWDNVQVRGEANLQAINRGDSGSGHGWSGATMVFWNCSARSVLVMRPPGAQNYAIGWTGPADAQSLGVTDDYAVILEWVNRRSRANIRYEGVPLMGDAHLESPRGPVSPRSLYLKQLEDRLGPAAVAVVTAPTAGPSL